MTKPCGSCGRTDHDEIAHLTASGAMKAARDAERRGDMSTALLWYSTSRTLSAKESRWQRGVVRELRKDGAK